MKNEKSTKPTTTNAECPNWRPPCLPRCSLTRSPCFTRNSNVSHENCRQTRTAGRGGRRRASSRFSFHRGASSLRQGAPTRHSRVAAPTWPRVDGNIRADKVNHTLRQRTRRDGCGLARKRPRPLRGRLSKVRRAPFARILLPNACFLLRKQGVRRPGAVCSRPLWGSDSSSREDATPVLVPEL